MDVVNDDAKAGFRRIEILTGATRQRRWSDDEKGRIVAETLVAGASVTEVARRWQVCPQQVWDWRRDAREGHLVLPGSASVPAFVPIAPEPPGIASDGRPEAAPEQPVNRAAAPSIEIRLAGAVVRVPAGTDGALLTEGLRAVRGSAT